MAQSGHVTSLLQSRCSRRALLGSSGLATLALAACGEETNTRQFAGGPQTPEANKTPALEIELPSGGSPTALPTRLPVSELLAPRGVSQFALIAHPDRLMTVDLASAETRSVWSDPDRAIWAVASTLSAERAAVLSAQSGSATGWTVDFVEAQGGPVGHVDLGTHRGTPEHRPDAVTSGKGGMAWIGETSSVAVAIPSGGLKQIFADGSQVPILPAAAAKRPAAVAVTADAGTIAFVDQPSGSEGSGIYAGSMRAKPIDPIVVLPADRSGNRYAHGLAWIASSGRVATVIDREELGNPQGDLFYIETETGKPTLAWTSPAGREVWSVQSIAVSGDGVVVAFLTNPSNPETRKPSSVWLMQIDGSAIERFELPVELSASRLVFSPHGVAASGLVRSGEDDPELGAVFLVSTAGAVAPLYLETPPATPVASPVASPHVSPAASPEASPSPRAIAKD